MTNLLYGTSMIWKPLQAFQDSSDKEHQIEVTALTLNLRSQPRSETQAENCGDSHFVRGKKVFRRKNYPARRLSLFLGTVQVSVCGGRLIQGCYGLTRGLLLVVFLLLPFDLLVAISLWLSELFYLPIAALAQRPVSSQKPNVERASIIILNWDGRHLLEEFLPSVLKAVRHDGRDHEVIVVDNGSRDESVNFLKDRYPQVKIVALPSNMRFTGGNNAGVRAAANDVGSF
jgi:hypothetical protein